MSSIRKSRDSLQGEIDYTIPLIANTKELFYSPPQDRIMNILSFKIPLSGSRLDPGRLSGGFLTIAAFFLATACDGFVFHNFFF